MRTIDFSIIIVSYNTCELTCRCVKALLRQEGVTFEIIVIDNASRDGTIFQLKSQFGNKIHIILNDENEGFGRANNIAVSKAHGKFLYLINPDALVQDTNALYLCKDFMQTHKRLGMLGTAIYEPTKQRFVKPKMDYPSQKYLRHTKFGKLPGKIAWLLGASMIIPRKVFKDVSGFDPDYFLYGEETDLALRIREAGYEIGFLDEVTVLHVSQASEAKEPPYETWLRKERGFYLFCQKHYDPRDLRRIAWMNLRRGYLRLASFFLKQFFSRRGTYTSKQLRWRATAEVAKEVLASRASRL